MLRDAKTLLPSAGIGRRVSRARRSITSKEGRAVFGVHGSRHGGLLAAGTLLSGRSQRPPMVALAFL